MIWLYSILAWFAFNGLALIVWVILCDYFRREERRVISKPYLVRTAGGVR